MLLLPHLFIAWCGGGPVSSKGEKKTERCRAERYRRITIYYLLSEEKKKDKRTKREESFSFLSKFFHASQKRLLFFYKKESVPLLSLSPPPSLSNLLHNQSIRFSYRRASHVSLPELTSDPHRSSGDPSRTSAAVAAGTHPHAPARSSPSSCPAAQAAAPW